MKVFLTCTENARDTLERTTIMRILNTRRNIMVKDVFSIFSSDEDVKYFMTQVFEPHEVYLLPEVPTDRLKGKGYSYEVIKPGSILDDMSTLAQVIAITGHQPTRYDNLVSAFASGYIEGLRAAGATEEEIKEIALRDRLIRGSTLKTERVAKERYEAGTVEGRCYIFKHGATNMSIIDHIAIQFGDLARTIIFTEDQEFVCDLEIFTSDSEAFRSVNMMLCANGYDVDTQKNSRTGLRTISAAFVQGQTRALRLEQLVKYANDPITYNIYDVEPTTV